MNKHTYYELSFGTYPGILFGFRTYEEKEEVESQSGKKGLLLVRNHVLYIPFFDFVVKLITLITEEDE